MWAQYFYTPFGGNSERRSGPQCGLNSCTNTQSHCRLGRCCPWTIHWTANRRGASPAMAVSHRQDVDRLENKGTNGVVLPRTLDSVTGGVAMACRFGMDPAGAREGVISEAACNTSDLEVCIPPLGGVVTGGGAPLRSGLMPPTPRSADLPGECGALSSRCLGPADADPLRRSVGDFSVMLLPCPGTILGPCSEPDNSRAARAMLPWPVPTGISAHLGTAAFFCCCCSCWCCCCMAPAIGVAEPFPQFATSIATVFSFGAGICGRAGWAWVSCCPCCRCGCCCCCSRASSLGRSNNPAARREAASRPSASASERATDSAHCRHSLTKAWRLFFSAERSARKACTSSGRDRCKA